MSAVIVTNLGKAYKQYRSRWARLAEWVLPHRRPRHELHWVLRDVSFRVEPGEAVGVIGINGGGKSTLLKLIVGTAQPTTGSVRTTGRVAALLELGMGFHPDFTGRQNVLMAGQLLGYSVDEIARLMPDIEAFAEIGDYIDRPVRVYSSGMQMRLAFSVATARRPDVLIVDEALSVGDAYFQHKSFDRIRTLRAQGTTLLIVSHDKSAIQSICDRAVLLDGGRVAMHGEPEMVMDYYNALLAGRETTVRQREMNSGKLQTVSGTGDARLEAIELLNSNGESVEVVAVGAPVVLRVRAQTRCALPRLVVGYMIKDRLGQPVYGTNTHHLGRVAEGLEAGDSVEYRFKFAAAVGPGSYSIAVALHAADTHLERNFEWRDLAVMFNVVNPRETEFTGTAWLPPTVECVDERRVLPRV